MDGLVSASGSSEDMALVKKLNALEVENKQLKKGDAIINIARIANAIQSTVTLNCQVTIIHVLSF